MGFGHVKTVKEKEWDEKYTLVKNSIRNKRLAMEESANAKQEKSLTYAEITKKIVEEGKKVKSLEDKPNELLLAKKKALSEEYDALLKENGGGWELWNTRGVWISKRVEEYLHSKEYTEVKYGLQDAINNYSKYTALKEEWEDDNADLIEAERLRSKRMELMQADPETLKALGISPDPTFTAPKVEETSTGYEKALKALHPSATDAEISARAKSV